MVKGGLGRGLNSLIPNKINNTLNEEQSAGGQINDADRQEKVWQIEVDKIAANPLQPRQTFDHADLEDLVNSIKKHGILQPLIVVKAGSGNYQLIAGERRLRAAKISEFKTVPCLIKDVEELQQLEMALIENVQRANLNPIEEAVAYQKLIDDFSLTQEEVASRVGKKRTTIANALRLLDLPDEVQSALRENKISVGHAKVILSAETETARLDILKQILKFNLTVRGAEGEVKKTQVKSHSRSVSKDPEIQEKEDLLRKALGTKVKVNKKGPSGQITIEFYSAEELNEIIQRIIS
ncbi:MAG: hypothetical protein COU22_02735 [Candidatus Komeilibacteria bacterium CG10_big_fil_rev_8_21_14_0_10_41_13]|uniref:ParB-like N-terminal domain-containing protein n=1 Tax=Candidatus Komeilibacteria bacterium CG10_big_fil_rev_8_21_14_0_10_41_13 TaxID=1974476 RepID=A0A2M6WBZ6_9BACT|nr:MAG: hypothetical protein COU22_02735 [Candidatus Komeilibacteria bacterium CG10_big_fil_rev_8_21_14_0_10_41_13]